jgi:5'(3')-deoxyribonucleotidase
MKIDPESVAFDIDGVLADTMTLFLEIARYEYNVDWVKYDDINCYKLEDCLKLDEGLIKEIITRIMDGDYTVPLKPIVGAPDVLTRLAKDYNPLLFVTARPYLGPIYDWVKGILQLDSASIEIITTGSFIAKVAVLLDREISYFVEDRIETCFSLRESGIIPVLFKQPSNRERHPFIEVGSWQELEALIDF